MLRPGASEPDPSQRRDQALFVFLLALVALTWVAFAHPPQQDFPGHAAMLAIRLRLPASAFLQQHFVAESLLGPYTVFLGLGHLFGPLLGAAGAMRLIGALANLALPCAVWWAHGRVGGARWVGAGLLALPIALGHLNAQGLLSFLLGLAPFVIGFALWVERATAPEPGRAAPLVLVGALTAFTHGFAFLLLLLAVALTLVAAGPRGWARLGARALVFLPALALLVAVYLRDRGLYPPEPQDGLLAWRGFGKLQLPFLTTYFSRLGGDVLVAALLWPLLGLTTTRALKAPGADRVSQRRRMIATTAIGFAALALIAPMRVDFFGSCDLRLACAALLLAILAVDPARAGRLGQALRVGPRFVAVVTVVTLCLAGLGFQREARPIDDLLARVPAGSRLLSLPVEPHSQYWAAAPFWHREKMLLLARDVLVANVWLHQATALRPTPHAQALLQVQPRATRGGEVRWEDFDLEPWDRILVRSGRFSPPPAPHNFELVGSAGGLHLYNNLGRARMQESRPPR